MTTKTSRSPMTTKPIFRAGQTVILCTPRHRREADEREVVIERVGRKYAYITIYGGEAAFDLATGVEKADAYLARRIYTPEGLAERKRRDAAQGTLRGITRDYGWERSLSTDQTERINAILAEVRP